VSATTATVGRERRGIAIEFRGVTKAFGGKQVLRGIDLAVAPGEVMFIIGTSGVGKSVTIKHVVGLIAPDSGEILVDGARVDQLDEEGFYPVRKRVAMVFQFATLFDSMTLADNVALPLRKHKHMKVREADAAARELLRRVHMEPWAGRYPAEIGDGMRKRAAIARALALDPACVLFDEPTTGLDPISARRIDRLIRELSDDLGVTAMVVSHDLASIFSIADRIAMVYRGIIHAVGTREEIQASRDPIVQQFISGRSSGPMETPGF
jgi:phospholipid/cholesterol/gamma-HCH transport system ATP-binding protein